MNEVELTGLEAVARRINIPDCTETLRGSAGSTFLWEEEPERREKVANINFCLPPPTFCQCGDSHWFTALADKSGDRFDDKSRGGGGVPLSGISAWTRLVWRGGRFQKSCLLLLARPSVRGAFDRDANKSGAERGEFAVFGPKGGEARIC